MKLIYKPRDEDPQETKVFDVVFKAGEPVEIPPGREWLGERLKANPWFELVEDAPDPAPNMRKLSEMSELLDPVPDQGDPTVH